MTIQCFDHLVVREGARLELGTVADAIRKAELYAVDKQEVETDAQRAVPVAAPKRVVARLIAARFQGLGLCEQPRLPFGHRSSPLSSLDGLYALRSWSTLQGCFAIPQTALCGKAEPALAGAARPPQRRSRRDCSEV